MRPREPMLSVETQREIIALLHTTDHSQREIARIADVSRSSVGNIKWRGVVVEPYRPPIRQRVTEYAEFGRKNPRARCPRCGVEVEMPCLACYVRRLKTETWLQRTIRERKERGGQKSE